MCSHLESRVEGDDAVIGQMNAADVMRLRRIFVAANRVAPSAACLIETNMHELVDRRAENGPSAWLQCHCGATAEKFQLQLAH